VTGLKVLILAFALLAATAAADPGSNTQESEVTDMQSVHGKLAVSCFNDCWTLIEKPERSAEDVENMLLLADASLWHWKQREDCKPQNLSVGYWLVSRVHALAEQYEMAKLFGEKCLKVGEENELPPFYVGYAYEALARAEVLHEDFRSAEGFLVKARKELQRITEKEERDLLEADLAELEKAIPKKPGADEGK